MRDRKRRVNPKSGLGVRGKVIEAASFEEAMVMGEELLPVEEEKATPKPKLEPDFGKYFLMKADAEHENVDWVGMYIGSGRYASMAPPNKSFPRPPEARLYEVERVWVKVS